MKELWEILRAVRAEPGRRWALATLVGVRGSSYRQPGARLLMDEHGPVLGAISGGCLEGDVFARAQEAVASGAPRLIDYDLRGDLDLIWGSGSGCEGEARILVEPLDPGAPWLAFAEERLSARREARIAIRLDGRLGERVCGGPGLEMEDAFVESILPPIALFIFGAGEEVRPLVSLSKALGWQVFVGDHRPAFAKQARFPEADEVRAGHPAQLIPSLSLDARSAAVLLSHNYLKDLEALRLLMNGPLPYVGLMGHRRRAERLVVELESEGVRVDERLFAPVGLDLGAESPETQALAIAAEIQARFGGRDGGFLRDRLGAIHGERA